MPQIALSRIPELKGLLIIRSQAALKQFLSKLRQDYYSPKELRKHKLEDSLEDWLGSARKDTVLFFAVSDDEDGPKNDGWGAYKLYRGLAMRSSAGKVHVFLAQIMTFWH